MSRFETFLAFLKKEVKIKSSVRVRLTDMVGHGSTSMSDRHVITVCIRKGDPAAMQLDTLVHEWGHVVEYDKIRLHGKTWGIGTSMAYEAWEKFTEEGG